jgi:hypothetical protein
LSELGDVLLHVLDLVLFGLVALFLLVLLLLAGLHELVVVTCCVQKEYGQGKGQVSIQNRSR